MNYNPFISLNIDNLSRLNNQRGLFMWDFCEIATRVHFIDSQPNYIFHHDGNVYSGGFIDRSYIYPAPNSLEHEIIRFGERKNVFNFHEYFLPTLSKDESFTVFSIPEIESVTEKYLTEFSWDPDFGKPITAYSENKESIEVELVSNYSSNMQEIIEKNRKSLKSGIKFEVNIIHEALNRAPIDEDLNKKINEVIQTLICYNYSSNEIATVIDSFLKKFIALRRNNEIADFNEFATLYTRGEYHFDFNPDEIIKIGLVDNSGINTYAYLPDDYLSNVIESRILEIRNNPHFVNNTEIIPLLENYWGLFLDLNQHPQKLFNFEEIRYIFLNFILPYQFIARPPHSRIYTIKDLKILGPE